MIYGSGFIAQSQGSRVKWVNSSGFRVQGSWLRIHG
jgi:hypothetical protein